MFLIIIHKPKEVDWAQENFQVSTKNQTLYYSIVPNIKRESSIFISSKRPLILIEQKENWTEKDVKQLFNNSLFSLYTNPIEKTIHLIANDELFYTDYFIYDKSGKLLMSGKIKSEVTTINTDNLSNGNYFMTIANKFMQSFCVSKK